MVTIINSSTSLRTILNYNEKKVGKEVAVCLAASGYPKDHCDLSFTAKLNRLTNQAALRATVKNPGVHISINFDPSEHLSPEKLINIASDYMEGIGFGEQPYLVYQHHDAGHPHLHIVTLSIDQNGKSVETSNIGRGKSEATRKALELKYGLIKAQEAKKNSLSQPQAVYASEAIYGHTDTRSAIAKVLNTVLKKYNYTSLAELNALLKQYNIMADRGSEDSRVFKHGGLLYHIIDKEGNKIGKPIKSSRFFGKPTLTYLQERFVKNEAVRKQHRAEKTRLCNTLGLLLLDKNCNTLEKFTKALKKEGIDTALRQNGQGRIYGLTFVDHRTQYVFNGSQLGKAYSAAAILNHFSPLTPKGEQENTRYKISFPNPPLIWEARSNSNVENGIPLSLSIVEAFLQPEYDDQQLPWHLRIGTKKKKQGRKGQRKI